ncbi:UNVERIFIED_CONTAM: hypothetical protein H355_013882 [Colinus virginianus]|nr:hypothetical protein H355_013882 [Colinus virginianus]
MFLPRSAFPQQRDGAAGNARSSAPAFPSAVPSSASGRGRSKQLKGVRVAEHFEIALNLALEQFLRSDDQEVSFPLCFTSDDRAFAHRQCQSLGLITKSKGKGSERYLTVRKKDGSEVIHAEMTCCLTSRTKQTICNLICRLPLTNKERIELLPRTQRRNACAIETENKEAGKSGGQLSCGIPQVPLRRGKSEYDSFRQSLPVFEKEEEIVKIIKENKVVLIIGETGSGKTTQIPQFLLDDCCENGIPCCIFCTQPRRLAVIAVAERVAAERREQVGQTVGYQVRLQSRY